ncbi:MAG: ABC transporter permease [Bacillati bacterium ANGP1]|uniref:ABC transporter permease n=1 Tax=Candidatus Segetimicrobium genomatis TaxID=2569760 RepID=A0A537IQF9_9BACT|nr:MAG: ABC transporter permease [Terrabacteria group bacterium ANGP1]
MQDVAQLGRLRRVGPAAVDYTRWVTIATFFLAWQLLAAYNAVHQVFNPVFLPSPTMVLRAGRDLLGTGVLYLHILQSAWRLLIGFSLGTSVAVVVGILVGRSRRLESIAAPLLDLVGPIPPFALLPIFIIWFGVGELPKLVFIAYATFLPVLAYTVDGVKSVNPLLIRSAYSLGASEMQIFRRVVLKSALPNIFVGMRVSLALSFSALVVAEMIGADAGLGYLIIDSRNFFRMANMFLAASLIGVEYTLFSLLLGRVEARLFRWRKGGYAHALER